MSAVGEYVTLGNWTIPFCHGSNAEAIGPSFAATDKLQAIRACFLSRALKIQVELNHVQQEVQFFLRYGATAL